MRRHRRNRRHGRNIGGLGGLGAPPRGWFNRRAPSGRACYKTKTDALNAFRSHNQVLIDELGGLGTPIDDELDGQPWVKTLSDAMWAAMGTKRGPHCLADIDVDMLNDLSLAALDGAGFTLPDDIQEQIDAENANVEQEDRAIDDGLVDQCFTKKRGRRGTFNKKRAPVPPSHKERACVCRDASGRFKRCAPVVGDDVPF